MRHILLYESFNLPKFNPETFSFANNLTGKDLFRFYLDDGSGSGAIGFLTSEDLMRIQEGLNDIACDEQIWGLLGHSIIGSSEYLKYGLGQSHAYEIQIEPIPPAHKWLLWSSHTPDLLGGMNDRDRDKIGAAFKALDEPSITSSFINTRGEMEEVPRYTTHDGKDSRLMIRPLEKQGRSEYPKGIFWASTNEEEDAQYNIPIIPHRLFMYTSYDDGFFEMTPGEFTAHYRSQLRPLSKESIGEQYPDGISDKIKREFLNSLVQAEASEDILDRMTRVLY